MSDLAKEWDNAAPISSSLEADWDAADTKHKSNIYSVARDYFREYGRPLMEMGGLTAGAVVGAGVGAPTGPGASVTGVAGAGLGYGIGKKGADIIESGLGELAGEDIESKSVGQELISSGKDVLTGAAFQAGGEVAGKYIFEPVFKGGKWIFNEGKSLFTKKMTSRLQSKAADIWVANTSKGPIYAKNAKEAADLETSIPGLKFTYGQRTYDPKEIRLERSQFRKPGDAAQTNAEQIASNDEALKAYYQKNFSSKRGVDDMLSAIEGERGKLTEGVERATGLASSAESDLTPSMNVNKISDNVIKKLKAEKIYTSKEIGKLYDEIPNVDVPSSNMINEFKRISEPTSKVESPSNYPDVLKRALKEYAPKEMPEELKNIVDAYKKSGQKMPSQLEEEIGKYAMGDTLPFQEVRGLRTEILNEIRSEAAKNNSSRMKRLREMQKVVEDTLDQLSNESQYSEDIVNTYRIASKQWKEYSDIYKRGAVGDILQGGPKGEISKLTPERILNSVFDPKNTRAADQLIDAIGKDNAKELVGEYAKYDLMRKSVNPVTGDISRNKLMSWISKNKELLNKYGISGEFKNISNAKALVDEANAAKLAFEKSQAAKILGVDPEKAIQALFTGKGGMNSAQTARDMMKLLEGNEAAKEGFRKAFGDFAVEKIKVSTRDIVGNPTASLAKFDALYQKLAPAIRVLYRDTPHKIKTLLDMKKAYEIMIRNQRSPFGGGSDTAENLLQTIATLGGPVARTSRTATAIKAVVRMFSNYEQGLIDKVINNAIFNPEYAETLEMLASRIPKISAIGEKRFAKHITAITALEAKRNVDKAMQ